MHVRTRAWFQAMTVSMLVAGCATSSPPAGSADAEAQALQDRARMYRADAERTPGTLSAERKADLERLASDVRAWQSRTGRKDITVTETRKTMARDASDTGPSGNCDADCPVYTLEGDELCFLVKSECHDPTGDDPDSVLQIGTICVYQCISIGSQATPERQGP